MYWNELIKLHWNIKLCMGYLYQNFVAPFAAEIRQSADQVRMKLTSELISGISRVLQKLHNYFNGTAISTSFVFTLFGVLPVIYFFWI